MLLLFKQKQRISAHVNTKLIVRNSPSRSHSVNKTILQQQPVFSVYDHTILCLKKWPNFETVKFLWLFGGSEVCLPDSATTIQLCRRFHQYAHCVCSPDAYQLFQLYPQSADAVLRPTFVQKFCYKLPSVVTFTFSLQSFVYFTERCQSWRICVLYCPHVYTICYLLHVQILYTDLDSIYHTFHKYLKLLDIITLLYPMLLIIICLLVHSRS